VSLSVVVKVASHSMGLGRTSVVGSTVVQGGQRVPEQILLVHSRFIASGRPLLSNEIY